MGTRGGEHKTQRDKVWQLSVYETEAYFYHKNIYPGQLELTEDKNFNLKLSKMLYYNILRCLFVDVQTQTSLKQKDTLLDYPHVEFVPPQPPKRDRF